MRQNHSDWFRFGATAAVALSTCAVAQLYAHRILWKLADATCVFADWDGFAEVASASPFGCIDWLARYLCATGLTGWGWVVPLLMLAVAMLLAHRIRGIHPAFAAWLPAILFVVPLLSLGDKVWLLLAPHFLIWNLLWFIVFAAVAAFSGRKGLAALLAILVVMPVGVYLVRDLPLEETVLRGFGFYPSFTWLPGSFVTLGVFVAFIVLSSFELPRLKPPIADLVPPIVLVILTAALWQNRDCRDQLAMERLVQERKFAEVLKIAPSKPRPRRMESAWRILAMYRTDRLDHDLFRYPVSESHLTTEEEEMVMEGPMFMFEFGLIQPYRRWIMETIAVKGWQPQYLRLLGEGAVISGDLALALRKFRQLRRCPFRGDYADRRVRALEAQPVDASAFSDIAELASMYEVWGQFAYDRKVDYIGDDRNVERLVYNLFGALKTGPAQMLKMSIAAMILVGRTDVVRENRENIRALYPDGQIGPAFMEVLK